MITFERICRSINHRMMTKLAKLNCVRDLLSWGYEGRTDLKSDLFPNVDPAVATESLIREGVYCGFKLPQDILSEIQEFASRAPVYGNKNPFWGFVPGNLHKAQERVNSTFAVANYINPHLECPAIQTIANDPVINEIALHYVGPRAKFLGADMWWSYAHASTASDQNRYAQLFHYDLDDYKFVKFFFYLTDVDRDSGSHVYVKGSHRKKPWQYLYRMRRFSDAEVEQAYGSEKIFEITGQAGNGFVEDTFGIHKGAVPELRNRLLLQLYFAISRGCTDGSVSFEYKMLELE